MSATSDGGLIISGSLSYSGSVQYMVVVKLSSTGQIEWAHRIGEQTFNSGRTALSTQDGGFVALLSPTDLNPPNSRSAQVIRFTQDGEVQWAAEIASSD